MNNLVRRISQAERDVGIDSRPALVPVLIIGVDESVDDRLPRFPESINEWVTARRAVAEATRERLPCIFVADPLAEPEARATLNSKENSHAWTGDANQTA